jgi:hypothetical protein
VNGPLLPLNRTAHLSAAAAGNPASAHLASGVANCFPGLEFDHRNLDRRFFPGLVFEFDDQLDLGSMGAVVVAVDLGDPMLQDPVVGTPELLTDLSAIQADIGSRSVSWWLATVEQDGVLIDPSTVGGWPLLGSETWRLVRSLEATPVRIVVRRFQFDETGENRTATAERILRGARRPYLVPGSTIDAAFAAGELSQSLCSPWQHDFRDCGLLLLGLEPSRHRSRWHDRRALAARRRVAAVAPCPGSDRRRAGDGLLRDQPALPGARHRPTRQRVGRALQAGRH